MRKLQIQVEGWRPFNEGMAGHALGEPQDVMRARSTWIGRYPADGQVLVQGQRGRVELPGRADVPRPLPGPAAAAVHARRRAVRHRVVAGAGAGFAVGDRVLGTPTSGALSEYALLSTG